MQFLSKSSSFSRPPPWRAASSKSCKDRPSSLLPARPSRWSLDSWRLNAPASISASFSGESSPPGGGSGPAAVAGHSKTSERPSDSREGATLRQPRSAASSTAEVAEFPERSSCTRQSAATAREAKPAEQRPEPSRKREPRQPWVFSSIARAAAPASPTPGFRLRSRAYGPCLAVARAASCCWDEASGKKLRATASHPSGVSAFPLRFSSRRPPPELSCRKRTQLARLKTASSVRLFRARDSRVSEGHRSRSDPSRHASFVPVLQPSRSSFVTRSGRSISCTSCTRASTDMGPRAAAGAGGRGPPRRPQGPWVRPSMSRPAGGRA
mmetsp:Transcript_110617/g.308146  ORF Transcript_110617/g.308146 Transcript_110617/m.308146 type:complete len:325 (+) Transcript_110617:626-1600(+)